MADNIPVKPTEEQKVVSDVKVVAKDIGEGLTVFEKIIKAIGQMVNSSRDIAVVVIGVLVLSSMGLLGKFSCSTAQKNSELVAKVSAGDLALGRATTELSNAKIKVNDLSKQVQKDMDNLKEQVTKYAQLEAEYKTAKAQNGNATVVYNGTATVCGANIQPGMIYVATDDNKIIAVKSLSDNLIDNRLNITCGVQPVTNEQGKIPMSIGYNLDLKLRGELVETRTESGVVNNYLNIYEIDKTTGKDLGKFELTKFNVIQNNAMAPHLLWWDPRLDLAVSLGVQGLAPAAGVSVGLSFSGYGSSATDLYWRFARLSVDITDKEPGIGFVPVLYNVTKLFGTTIVSDVWVGPGASYNIKGSLLLGAFVGVAL